MFSIFFHGYIHKEKTTISSKQNVLSNFFPMSINIKKNLQFRQNKKCSPTFSSVYIRKENTTISSEQNVLSNIFPLSIYRKKKTIISSEQKVLYNFFPCQKT